MGRARKHLGRTSLLWLWVPAKLLRIGLGAQIIKTREGRPDKELIEENKEEQ
jgi:hypothetical protein